jgi:PBP1b-binding outer membrane lipoprotein LpoB
MKSAYAILALLLAGCQGMTPALAGKTNYSVEFQDTTADQNTTYRMQIKAPAGVDLASVAAMSYDWQPDGSGGIRVSSDAGIDTTQQAAAAVEVGRQQIEAINLVLNALAPVIGQQIQSNDNQTRMRTENDGEKLRAAIELIEKEMARQEAE